jgi:hypothetical protein
MTTPRADVYHALQSHERPRPPRWVYDLEELKRLPSRVTILCADGDVRATVHSPAAPAGVVLAEFTAKVVADHDQIAALLPARVLHDPSDHRP